MATIIQHNNLSLAWLQALEHLANCETRKDVNLSIAIQQPGTEDGYIRQTIDAHLSAKKCWSVQTVANTIFPEALYLSHLGEEARQHFYGASKEGFEFARRHTANSRGRYIQRFIAWPGRKGEVNQLENIVQRLRRQKTRTGPLSSWYEIGIAEPEEDAGWGADLRVNEPGHDNSPRGFPCLSHISLTLKGGELHMTAMYRNQQFFQRAYGNYLGLSRLLNFLCHEVGCSAGEILCVATHADAEISKRDLSALIRECRTSISK